MTKNLPGVHAGDAGTISLEKMKNVRNVDLTRDIEVRTFSNV
jgi:hypothetical protein